MANNIQFLSTSVSGRLPNTTNSSNTAYIGAGSFAINFTDQTFVSSNGSAIFYIGGNVVNQTVSGVLSPNSISANGSVGSAGQVLTSNGAGV